MPQQLPELAQVLADVEQLLRRYLVASDDQYVAIALWVAFTYCTPAFDFAPRLTFESPEKRCGKSRAQELLRKLAFRPVPTVNLSAAALYHLLPENPTDRPPTLLIDEADTIFKRSASGDEQNEALRGLLNAGFSRDNPVLRYDVSTRTTVPFQTFAPVSLAAIHALPDTVMDRSIVVRMRRKTRNEGVARFRQRTVSREAAPIADVLLSLAGPTLLDDLRNYVDGDQVAEIDEIHDRANDCWEPLVALADFAGGDWPVRARRSAVALTAPEDEAGRPSFGLRLLRVVRDVVTPYLGQDVPHFHTAWVLQEVRRRRESWDGLNEDSFPPLLTEYGVVKAKRRVPGHPNPVACFLTPSLQDAFDRYLTNEQDEGEAA